MSRKKSYIKTFFTYLAWVWYGDNFFYYTGMETVQCMPDKYFANDQYFISKLKPKTSALDEF